MQPEVFETKRDFNKKFPGKVYICFWCNQLTTNPNICTNCGRQANTLMENKGFKYKIKSESEQIITIFKPIEMEN